MITRLRHWWRHLCGEYVTASWSGGGDMTRAWEW